MATTDAATRQTQNALRLLDHTVDGLARRQRRQIALQCVTDALFWGLGAAAFAVLLLRLAGQSHSLLIVTVLFIVAAVTINVFLVFRNLPDKLSVAIVADEKLQFKQRLSTAWEFRQARPKSELTAALALQAGGARLPSVSAVFPFELNLWGMLVPLAASLLLLASLVDIEVPDNVTGLIQVDERVIEEGSRLEAFARRMHQRSEREGYARSLAQSVELQELGAEMKSGALMRKQALQKLQRLQRSITSQRAAALADTASGSNKYHTDQASPNPASDSLVEALHQSGLSGIATLRDRLSANRLSPEDLEALNRSLESLDPADLSSEKLRSALDRYSQGEAEELQQILDNLTEVEKNSMDADELENARVAVMRSRENLGDESGSEQRALLQSDGLAFGDGGQLGNDNQYTLSEFPGDASGGGLGMSQTSTAFLTPDEQAADSQAQSATNQVTLKPEAQIKQGDSFRSETWTLPEDGAATIGNVTLDTQFQNQLESVLVAEKYPLHRKELVRQYFLNLSQGASDSTPVNNKEDR